MYVTTHDDEPLTETRLRRAVIHSTCATAESK
jgi:hypothetical protein